MLSSRCFNNLIANKRLYVPICRLFHHEFSKPEGKETKNEQNPSNKPVSKEDAAETTLSGAVVRQKYKVFRDEEATEIFDVEEERERYQAQQSQPDEENNEECIDEAYIGINLKRGINGVFDIEDLIDVLRKENAEDVFVCSVPKDLKYVDYMVICSGRSYRHMLAMAEFVRHIFKVKRSKNDILPKIEGEKSRDWMALDLGNIALHIFSPGAREEYDLESLWAIGPEYDKESNKPEDPLVELFEKHSQLFVGSTTKNPVT